MKTEKEELAWLAGAWDGEGSISIFPRFERYRYRNGEKEIEKNPFRKLTATLTLVNTEQSFMAEAIRILDKHGIAVWVQERKLNKRNKNHSDCWQLVCRKLEAIKKFLELIFPYLISKKPQADLVLRFVNSRLEQLSKRKNGLGYTEEEQSLEQQIRILNKRGQNESSTTIRQTPKGDDIV